MFLQSRIILLCMYFRGECGHVQLNCSDPVSSLDDPLIWGFLPMRFFFNPTQMRWSLGSYDICFQGRYVAHSYILKPPSNYLKAQPAPLPLFSTLVRFCLPIAGPTPKTAASSNQQYHNVSDFSQTVLSQLLHLLTPIGLSESKTKPWSQPHLQITASQTRSPTQHIPTPQPEVISSQLPHPTRQDGIVGSISSQKEKYINIHNML
jgi:hypothetical protein